MRNFGFVDRKFNERGSNFKISEVSAAAILQYWDTFNIETLKDKILDSYFDELFKLNSQDMGDILPNHADDNIFYQCVYLYTFRKQTTRK